ncbi:NAD-dependent epimerase/dehydratase family protein [bacterium]|nr:NAD-dependent epimerase/dehydratase family protein [bacterium]
MANRLDELSKERFLVTGGAGFIGSNIVQRLLSIGASIIVLDDFYTGTEKNLPSPNSRLEVIRGSVVDFDLVRDIVKEVDYVIHEAARNIIVSTQNPHDDYEVNIGGTLNILLAARKAEIKRVVYASSASVYGNPRYLPINEDDMTNLLSPYAVSKFSGESYCRAFYESYGLSTTAVRYSNVYGPYQRIDNPYCGVISKFFHAAMTGEPLSIHGDGDQTRDFSYIDDVVDATLLAATFAKAEGQVYNVGTGRETTLNQLAHLIIETVGVDAKFAYIDRRDIDNIRRRVVNIEKIRRDLRWIPCVTLEEGLRRTYRWLLESEEK